MENQEKVCCPKFHPEKWDRKTFNWENKPFIKENIRTFFHMPLPSTINTKVTKLCDLAEKAGASGSDPENVLLLFRDPTAFRSEIYLSVSKEVPGAENVSISGTFFARVFSGPYNSVPKFIKEINQELAAENKTPKDYYVHYAYCPKCAKKFGNNYMIIFARI